jgi:hypothetical protein
MAVWSYADYIKRETLAVKLDVKETQGATALTHSGEFDVDGAPCRIGLSVAAP